MAITTWTRLEPDTQTGNLQRDIAEGVLARLADPLWLLGRQWQLSELQGEDAASPVMARIRASSYLIDRLTTTDGDVSLDREHMLVERLVEHDGGPVDSRTRQAGWRSFRERLIEEGLAAEASRLAVAFPDRNGDAILGALDSGTLASDLQLQPAMHAILAFVATAWAEWYRPRASRVTNPVFLADRLAYSFLLSAEVSEGRATLEAPEHAGGRLDWQEFSWREPSGEASTAPESANVEAAPALLEIPGMPSPWFWELEDPAFDAGGVAVDATDPGRLLLIETLLAYASDWFLLPLRLPVGSLSRIETLEVTDTFGVVSLILPVETVRPHPGWSLWRTGPVPYLLLPPAESHGLVSEPIEECLLVRDEGANMAWAVRTVPAAPEGPEQSPDSPRPDADETYIPISTVPSDYIPLVGVDGPDGIRRLRRARVLGRPDLDEPSSLVPKGFQIQDAVLAEEGFVLQRRYKFARSPDGKAHLWTEIVKRRGARVTPTGLVFDSLQRHESSE